MEVTLSVEERLGRVRTTRWGPRTADLDILLIGTLQISEPALTVPHPRMRERQFVLVPLAEIAPDLELPDGTLVRDLAEGESESVRRIGRLTDVLSQEPESREVGG